MKYLALICAFFLLALPSCSQAPQASSKQELRLNIPSDPATLDPRKGGDLVSSLFHFLLFDGLYRLDDYGEVAPALAERTEISDDRTVYTFYLRESYWSDGTPITAWDFEKSWKDILRPDFPAMNANLLYPIKNAEAAKMGTGSISEVGIRSLDAKTLEVTLERPTPYFLDLVAFCVFYPVNAEIDHTHPDWDQQGGKGFVCSGPFNLKEWRRNNEIVIEKNPNYFRSEGVLLEKIHLSMVPSEMTSLQMFEKGQIDILGQPLIPLPSDAIPELSRKKQLKIHPVPATTFCTFNVDAFPFNNRNIRKAFAYAINRQQIVRNITQMSEEPAMAIIPPVLKKGEKTRFFHDADLEMARAHLDKGLEELGITLQEFPKVKLHYSTSESHHKVAQALQQQWKEVLGIHMVLERIDRKILIHLVKTGNYRTALSFWMAQYTDPMNIFERFKYKTNVKNYPNWENQRYIELLNLSGDARTDEERRKYLYEAEKIFLEEMPLAPIFHWNSAYITQPYVKSFGIAPIGNGFFDRVYIDTEKKNAMR